MGNTERAVTLVVASSLLPTLASAAPPRRDDQAMRDVVAAAIVGGGRAIVLATPGLERGSSHWRFRSFDTHDLPQPIDRVALAHTGTKLLIQYAGGVGVLDLTREYRHHTALQYVAPEDLAIDGRGPAHAHRLPGERFIAVVNGRSILLDDLGGVIAGDAPAAAAPPPAGDSPRARSAASLKACLEDQRALVAPGLIEDALQSLSRESRETWAAEGQEIEDWTFFHVDVDTSLYAPVLEFARLERVFPATFETLEGLAPGLAPRPGQRASDLLYDRYLRRGREALRANCNYYVLAQSHPGSWIVEYWLYYPFDVGGLGSHPHDPEHIFVEVDKLGGTVRRFIGAGHGYMAGNNMYSADRPGAAPIELPLFALVELGKHASAPDIDRDGLFTPGIDENEYHERAKVWGVRDVIGTINNELIAFDSTMSSQRRPLDYLAPASLAPHFPGQADIAPAASCQLMPLGMEPPAHSKPTLGDWVQLPPCHELTSECAKRHVSAHPDFLDTRTILKEWSFPASFLRASYGLGPRRGLHSVGVGYAMDMDRVPGLKHVMSLPGRIGGDVFYWHQPANPIGSGPGRVTEDRDSCPGRVVFGGETDCPRAQGVGWDVRYEQFLSNLFGIYSAVRVFSPPLGDAWITFGPFVEVPLGRRSNALVQGGLSFRPYESPRFELRVSVGLWKPKTNHIGIQAGSDAER